MTPKKYTQNFHTPKNIHFSENPKKYWNSEIWPPKKWSEPTYVWKYLSTPPPPPPPGYGLVWHLMHLITTCQKDSYSGLHRCVYLAIGCLSQKQLWKQSLWFLHSDRRLIFKHGMAWGYKIKKKGIESCVWRFYLFVVYLFGYLL